MCDVLANHCSVKLSHQVSWYLLASVRPGSDCAPLERDHFDQCARAPLIDIVQIHVRGLHIGASWCTHLCKAHLCSMHELLLSGRQRDWYLDIVHLWHPRPQASCLDHCGFVMHQHLCRSRRGLLEKHTVVKNTIICKHHVRWLAVCCCHRQRCLLLGREWGYLDCLLLHLLPQKLCNRQ